MSDAVERLDECLSVRDGELYVEGCRDPGAGASGSARRSTSSRRTSFAETRAASSPRSRSRWPGEFLLLPSIKANSSLALRRILTDEGTGCDVFGPGELEAALRAGTDPERISLNGPMKDDALLERAIRAGCSDHARQPRRAESHGGGRRAV